MFELNLIKDKARARQRRRIIVLSVISVVFLSALCSVFVGFMTANEKTKADQEKSTAQRYDGQVTALRTRLEAEMPKARKRKAALKAAWEEDKKLFTDRVFLSPVLSQLTQYKPSRGQFWYSEIAVTLLTQPATPNQPPVSPLRASRALSGMGVVQIIESDIVTTNELNRVGAQIAESAAFTQAVGVPQYSLDFEGEGSGRQGGSAGRYARFIVTARRESGRGEQ